MTGAMPTVASKVNVQETHQLYRQFGHLFVNPSRHVCDGTNVCEEVRQRRMRGGRGRLKHSTYCNGGPNFGGEVHDSVDVGDL